MRLPGYGTGACDTRCITFIHLLCKRGDGPPSPSAFTESIDRETWQWRWSASSGVATCLLTCAACRRICHSWTSHAPRLHEEHPARHHEQAPCRSTDIKHRALATGHEDHHHPGELTTARTNALLLADHEDCQSRRSWIRTVRAARTGSARRSVGIAHRVQNLKSVGDARGGRSVRRGTSVRRRRFAAAARRSGLRDWTSLTSWM